MTTRAHFYTYVLDEEGRPIPGATVTVRDPGTDDDISETIYDADAPAMTTKTNPFMGTVDGLVEFYLDVPAVVDLLITKVGLDSRTRRATVIQLEGSTNVILSDSTPMEQRAGLDFSPSFVLTDDSEEDETLVEVDFGTPANQAFGDSATEGTGDEVANAKHKHGMPANPVTQHLVDYAHGDIAVAKAAAIAAQGTADAHIADTTAAHAAASISYAGGTGMSATDVEAAIDELATEKSDTGHNHTAAITGAVATHAGESDPHTGYQKESEKAQANGYASLDSSTLLPVAQLPQHDGRKHAFIGAKIKPTSDSNVIGNGSDIGLTLATEVYDRGGWHTGSDGFVVPAGYAGFVRVKMQADFTSNSSGIRRCNILLNGNQIGAKGIESAPSAGTPATVDCDVDLEVAEGDEIDFSVAQTSGSTLQYREVATWASIEFLGA